MRNEIHSGTTQNQITPTHISSLVGATVLSILAAVFSGAALLAFGITDGSSTESTLGLIAASSGLLSALFGSLSLAMLFRWQSWSLMPVWAKIYTSSLGAFLVGAFIYRIVDSSNV